MVHLNEWYEKYATKGLIVVSVSTESRATVDEFIEKNQVKHPVALVEDSVFSMLGIQGYPTAFLVGPDGRVLYSGHPGELSSAKLEEHLATARMPPAIPKALSAVEKSIEKSKLADAWTKVNKALEDAKLEGDDRTAAEQVKEWLDWLATSSLEGAAKDLSDGRAYEAWVVYDELADAWKGHDYGKQADAAAKDLLSDKDRKREVDAGKKLAKAMEQALDASPNKAVKIFEDVAKRYEGTKAGTRAADLAREAARR